MTKSAIEFWMQIWYHNPQVFSDFNSKGDNNGSIC